MEAGYNLDGIWHDEKGKDRCPRCGGALRHGFNASTYTCNKCGVSIGVGVEERFIPQPDLVPQDTFMGLVKAFIFFCMLIILIAYFLITYLWLGCFDLTIFIILIVITVLSFLIACYNPQ